MKNTSIIFENSLKKYINTSFKEYFSSLLDKQPLYISDFFKSINQKIQSNLSSFDSRYQPPLPIFNKNFEYFQSKQEIISTSEIEYTFSFQHRTPLNIPVLLYFQYFDVLSQNIYLKLLPFLIPEKDLNQPIIDMQFQRISKDCISDKLWPNYTITLHFKNISDMNNVNVFLQFFWSNLQEQSQLLAMHSLSLYFDYTRNPENQKLILSTHFLNN